MLFEGELAGAWWGVCGAVAFLVTCGARWATGGAARRVEQRLEAVCKAADYAAPGAARVMADPAIGGLLGKAAPKLALPLTPTREAERSALKYRLAHAGYRNAGAVPLFLAAKTVLLLGGLALGAAIAWPLYGATQHTLLVVLLAGCIPYYLPDAFVIWRRSRRHLDIFLGLPDALDLLVVCVEAGLGLDAALRRVASEFARIRPYLSHELAIANWQLQVAIPRRDVLRDLSVRTGHEDLRALATVLVQADRFGSSIAQALRVQSDSMRERRRQQAEERAAKTAVKLILPLILFIFPGIFVVLVGPAGIAIYQGLITK